jgi:hypothetical protein
MITLLIVLAVVVLWVVYIEYAIVHDKKIRDQRDRANDKGHKLALKLLPLEDGWKSLSWYEQEERIAVLYSKYMRGGFA